MYKNFRLFFIFFICTSCANAQKIIKYNLAQLLQTNKLITNAGTETKTLNDSTYKDAVSTKKIVWLKDVPFKEGIIEIDLRGKDVFLQSFLGVAFHAADSMHYEVVYFRPFNFNHADTLRRKWSVQYMVVPDFLYDRLRKEHPLVFENAVRPVPRGDEWFHASIVVKGDSIKVYVNHSRNPCLQVKKLNKTYSGSVGLWDDELSGDFANLTIKK